MNPKRQRVRFVLLLLMGGALGAVVALPLARALHLRFAEEALFRYAQGILRTEEQSADEARSAWRQFSNIDATFCSDEEIGAMRRFVYNATFVKDLGRERGGTSTAPPAWADSISLFAFTNQRSRLTVWTMRNGWM